MSYIVVAPDYNENDGGAIVLHHLCHELNRLGESATLWPMRRLRFSKSGMNVRLKKYKTMAKEWVNGVDFRTNPELNTPISSWFAVSESSIVIYPEVIAGNPLAAKNVVRWLLHQPGFHTGVVDYDAEDYIFKFDDFAEVPAITGSGLPQLFLFVIHPAYENEGRKDRKGSCYILRKGAGRDLVHELEDSIKIDGLPHDVVADIFNQCETFYSYDEATMYSQFAALCGCVSVVIPKSFETREQWSKNHPLAKYGVAYGVHDRSHAIETQPLLMQYLNDLEAEGRSSVEEFVSLTKTRFLSDAPR